MVSYFSAGTQWATKAGNPAKIDIDERLRQEDRRADRHRAGRRHHRPVEEVHRPAASRRSRSSSTRRRTRRHRRRVQRQGRRMLADSPVGAYAVKQTNGAARAGRRDLRRRPRTATWSSKDQTAFAEALRDAVKALIADGSYQTASGQVGRRRRRHHRPRRSTRQTDACRRKRRHNRTGTAGTDPGRARPASRALGRRRRDRRCWWPCSSTCWSRTRRSSGRSWSTTCSGRRSWRGCAGTLAADRLRDDDRRQSRRRGRGHAAVGQPDPARRRPGLHLVLPGGAPAGAAIRLRQPRHPVEPGSSSGVPFDTQIGAAVRHRRLRGCGCSASTPASILTGFVAGMLGAGAVRGGVHGRDRPGRHPVGRPGADRGGRRRWA